MSHTPGPWIAMGWLNGTTTFGCLNVYQPKAGVEVCIAIDMPEADAHLTAAAPDLLEALEVLLDSYTALINSGDCGNWNPEEEPDVINARKAIAKARGES
jgi:hypothetical protein